MPHSRDIGLSFMRNQHDDVDGTQFYDETASGGTCSVVDEATEDSEEEGSRAEVQGSGRGVVKWIGGKEVADATRSSFA